MPKSYEDLEKEFRDFTYIVSHDFSACTRHIREFTKLLMKKLEGKIGADEEKYADIINRSTETLDAMLMGILQISRINTDESSPERVNFGKLVKEIEKERGNQLEAASGSLVVKDLPQLFCKKKQVQQLFSYLIDNAIKFRNHKHPLEIAISASKKNKLWEFSVEDNGIGIEAGLEQKIFKLFQTLHPQGAFPGVGAGLSVCKAIVESHGGEISCVQPDKGVGAKIIFTLPEDSSL